QEALRHQRTESSRFTLSTIHTDFVDKRGYDPVCVYRDVKRLMHQEVVAVALPDDPKIINEGLFYTDPTVQLTFLYTSTLVFVGRGLTQAADALRLQMSACVDATGTVDSESE